MSAWEAHFEQKGQEREGEKGRDFQRATRVRGAAGRTRLSKVGGVEPNTKLL